MYICSFIKGIHDANGSDVELRLAALGNWANLGKAVSHAMPYKGLMLTLSATNPQDSKRSHTLHGGVAGMTEHAKLHVNAFVNRETTSAVALSHTLRVQVPPLNMLPKRHGQFAVAETVFCKGQAPHNLCSLDRDMVRSGLDMQRVAADDAEAGNRDELIGVSFRFDACIGLASMPTIVPWALVSPGKVITMSTAFHSDNTIDIHVNDMNVATFVPVTPNWHASPVMASAHNGHRVCWMSQYQRMTFLSPNPADEKCSVEAAAAHTQSWSNYSHFGWYNYMKMPHDFQLRMSGPELALRAYEPNDRVEMLKNTISQVATWYGRIATPRAQELVIRAPEGHGFGAETLGRVATVSVHYADHASAAFRDIMTGWQDVSGQDMPNHKDFFPRAAGGVILEAQGGYILTSRKAVLGSASGPIGAEPPACRQFLIKCSSLRNAVAADKPEACLVARIVKLSSPELDLALLKVERGMGQGTALSRGTINPALINPGTYGSRGVKLLTRSMRKCLKPLNKLGKESTFPVTTMGWTHHEHDHTGWTSGSASVPASDLAYTNQEVVSTAKALPHMLASNPVYFELKGSSEAHHKCTGNRDTDTDRESAILAGITLQDTAVEAGRAASTSRFVPAQLIQSFLSACSQGHPHPLLDAKASEYGMPACIKLNVDERTGMFSAGTSHGMPTYQD